MMQCRTPHIDVSFCDTSSAYLFHAAHYMIRVPCSVCIYMKSTSSINLKSQSACQTSERRYYQFNITAHTSTPSVSPTLSLTPHSLPQIDHGHIMELDSAAVVSRVLMKSTETAPVSQSAVVVCASSSSDIPDTFENNWTSHSLWLCHHLTEIRQFSIALRCHIVCALVKGSTLSLFHLPPTTTTRT